MMQSIFIWVMSLIFNLSRNEHLALWNSSIAFEVELHILNNRTEQLTVNWTVLSTLYIIWQLNFWWVFKGDVNWTMSNEQMISIQSYFVCLGFFVLRIFKSNPKPHVEQEAHETTINPSLQSTPSNESRDFMVKDAQSSFMKD